MFWRSSAPFSRDPTTSLLRFTRSPGQSRRYGRGAFLTGTEKHARIVGYRDDRASLSTATLPDSLPTCLPAYSVDAPGQDPTVTTQGGCQPRGGASRNGVRRRL